MQSDMTEVEELNYFKDKHQTAPFSWCTDRQDES